MVAPPAVSRGGAHVNALTSNPGEVLASEVLSTLGPLGAEVISQHLVQYVGTNRTELARGDAEGMALMRRTKDGVYCAGRFRGVGGVPTGNLALWNGTNWARVGQGAFHGLSSEATCIAVGDTNVFAGGTFEYAGDVAAKHIARWDGTRWYPLGTGIEGAVLQIAARAGELFVIGTFTSASGVAATNIARWDGANWSKMGSGLTGRLDAIAASDQEVLVARIANATNVYVSRWNGTDWGDIASGTFGYERINSIKRMGNSVLIAGRFKSVNGIEMNNIARWEAGQWQSLGGGVSGQRESEPNLFPFTEVRALVLDGTNLYIGGSFTNANGIPAKNVAHWNGTEWSALGAGIPGFGSCLFRNCDYPVTSLALVQGRLFAAGWHDYEGHLEMWNGSSWSNVADAYRVMAVASRGPDLYLAGNFETIGRMPSYGFALWHEGEPPVLHVTFANGSIILRWPRAFQDAVLESTTSFNVVRWTPVINAAWEIADEQTGDVEVALTPVSNPTFYRLRWQSILMSPRQDLP